MESFLQSPEWQEIQERMGRRTFRIEGVLVVRHNLPLGLRYLYAPRPPEFPELFWSSLDDVAGREGAMAFKVDPSSPLSTPLAAVATASIQPTATVVIDCRVPAATLLRAMHPKARYNIRLALRHGVAIAVHPAADAAACAEFLRLLHATAGRDGFSLHPAEHYRTLLTVCSRDFMNELWLARHGGRVIAGAIVNWYRPSGIATYLHGASDHEYRRLMAPHLLHWRIMGEARERGYGTYDLGGVDEVRWPGLTRFKQGFGGEILVHPPSADLVLRPWPYRLYRFQRALRYLL